MTRRDFGLFIGMIPVAMIGTLDLLRGGVQTRPRADRDHHIRNKRLFHFAAGNITLVQWEHEHLHHCRTCQTMATLLIRSISEFPESQFKDVRS